MHRYILLNDTFSLHRCVNSHRVYICVYMSDDYFYIHILLCIYDLSHTINKVLIMQALGSHHNLFQTFGKLLWCKDLVGNCVYQSWELIVVFSHIWTVKTYISVDESSVW